jgi:hypothetical protein
MRILFAITALCLLVLLWAGLAIRRHIRAAARERAERQRPPAKAIIEVELKQELRAAKAERGFFGSLSDPQPARQSISKTRQAVRDSAIRAAVTASPVKISEPTPEFVEYTPVQINEAPAVNELRKPPVSISDGKFERLDLAHFNNKDLGDLSDPYQIPRAAGRNRS